MPENIAIFVTCMVDHMFPEVGVAAVRLLERYGFQVDFPHKQTCCGQPFSNSGFPDEGRTLAKNTIESLEPYDSVVVPSGSCAGMIRQEYLHLLADEPGWLARAQALSGKVFELSEFLTARVALHAKETAPPLQVSYHDSCHMLRILGLKDQPRTLLQQVGCEIVEMEEPERCCGFGGLFAARMHEVSQAMTAEKLRQAEATNAPILVTADPGCLMQMRGNQPEDFLVRIEHLAVLLEERAA